MSLSRWRYGKNRCSLKGKGPAAEVATRRLSSRPRRSVFKGDFGRGRSTIKTPKATARQKRSVDYQADPYLHVTEMAEAKSGRETPSLESVAVGVLRHPELLQEIFRRLAWLEKEQLEELRDAIDKALQHREDVLTACAEGNFGRDYVYRKAAEIVAVVSDD